MFEEKAIQAEYTEVGDTLCHPSNNKGGQCDQNPESKGGKGV